MLPISSSSSSVHSLISGSFCLISSFSSQIISKVLLPLACPPFHCLQFLSNLPQYSLLYLLSNYLNSFFAINCSSSSSLLNIPSSLSCCLIFSIFCQYSFSSSSTASFVFSKFSIPSQVLDSAVNPFYHTKYLFFSLICHLFRILLTSLSQLYYGPVVIYCMVYHYTKRATLTRLLVNEGPAIYVVLWTGILLYLYVTI